MGSDNNQEEIVNGNEETTLNQEMVNENVEAEGAETVEVVEDDAINEELKLTKDELAKEKDKFLRLFADFENYKRRTSKERIELFKTAGQDVVKAILPVLDDFDRALIEIEKVKEKDLAKGVVLISNKLKEALYAKGLSLMEVKQGDTFDADIHEAITQIPAPDKKLKGKVVDVVEKGYQLGDKIIRFPKVVVGK